MTSNFVNMTNTSARQLGTNINPTFIPNVNINNAKSAYRYSDSVADRVDISTPINAGAEKVQTALQNIDKKQAIKKAVSWALAIATTIGVAKVTNKNIDKIWKLGEALDGKVGTSKFCKKASEILNMVKDKNPLKNSKLAKDIKNVTSKANRVQPKSGWAKMSVLGPKGIFSLTASDVLKGIATNVGDKTKFTQYLEALVGKDAKICGKTVQEVAEACFKGGDLGESFKFSGDLMNAIKSKHNLKTTKEMFSFFDKLQAGKIGNESFDFAQNVNVKGWIKGSKGNLGDTLKKLSIMNGEGATTKAGKVAQQVPLILGESISNCINDRSLFGIMLCGASLPQIFDQAQEAKRGKKVATAAAELTSTAAGWAVGTAGAGAIVYSAASLKNLQSTGFMANALKKVGKVASMGLGSGSGKVAGFIGGAMRLVAVLTLSSKISKPIDNTIKKAFGVPTDAEKAKVEEAKVQMEALKQAQVQPQIQQQVRPQVGFSSFNI